ncbi:hypothetical protein ABZW10_04455 [Kitasatospora sp. NPDC004723]|uniref:S10 family serine carboxypeptidase-like protein n=1 Tax=Kitasatospora sp. NPDC004723 TaxID=3154288 RepID=UPI0033AE3F09
MPRQPVYSIPANVANTQTLHFYPDPEKKEEEGLPKTVRSYAGYADVSIPDIPESHLFYWFFESQTCDPDIDADKQKELIEQTPLLIWLNGGPGASSLAGLFLENGPLRIGDDAAGSISVSPDTWNQEAHVLYWDQPIGSGYSYCAGDKTYVKDEETLSQMFWLALQQFFATYPEYLKCPLYVCGESYAGKYVPYIAKKIHEQNRSSTGTHLNLAGIAVGNGWIRPELSIRVMIDYAYASGFLGLGQKDVLDFGYANFQEALRAGKMKKATDLGNGLVNAVLAFGGNFYLYDVRSWDGLSVGALPAYLNSDAVKTALHVDHEWQFADNSGPVADALKADIMADASPLYTKLIEAQEKYKVLLYTGDFDTACGYQSTEEILDEIMKDGWRNAKRLIWKQAQGHPKGFVRTLNNVTQVAVPDSGHEVPTYQPQISREMLYNWLFDRPFHGQDPTSAVQAILDKAQQDADQEKE